MSKLTAIIAAVLLAAFMLCSCGEEAELIPPKPTEITSEASDNSAGLRFAFTLKELSKKLDAAVRNLNGDTEEKPAEIGEWEIINKGLADDNGVMYTSYRNQKRAGTLTAAVEDKSGRLMNVGCGCDKSKLGSSDDRESYITLTALLAQQAGGFAEGDLAFLKKLIADLLDGGDESLYYEKTVYTKSEDKTATVIIMTPSAASYAQLRGIRFYGKD